MSIMRRASRCCAYRDWACAQSDRILTARRWRALRLQDVGRLTTTIVKVRPFIVTCDWRPVVLSDRANIDRWVKPKIEQLELFGS